MTEPILAQLNAKDKYKAYRQKVQRYADEEKRLWEDFRHGMIIGTKEFVERIRSKYMPDNFHKEIPQHRALGKSIAPEKVLEKAAGVLNCDLDDIRQSRRIPKSKKEDRDLLLYLVWKTCILTNEETGRLFGMTYSAVSHILSFMRTKIQKDSALRTKYNHICRVEPRCDSYRHGRRLCRFPGRPQSDCHTYLPLVPSSNRTSGFPRYGSPTTFPMGLSVTVVVDVQQLSELV